MTLAALTPAATVPVTPEERAALSMLRAACIDAAQRRASTYLGAVSSALMALAEGDIAHAVHAIHEHALGVAFRERHPRSESR